jgi:hypothetical protein
MSQVSIYEASGLLAPPGPDNETHLRMVLGELLEAAEAGDIAAGKVSPYRPPQLVFSGRDARGGSREQGQEKIIDGRSPVDLLEACIWRISKGHEVPKRARALLSVQEQARLAGAFSPPRENREKESEKLKMILGAVLMGLASSMPSKYKRGGELNVSALAQLVEGAIVREHGGARGYKETTVSEVLKDALALFPMTAESDNKAAQALI